ncbi:terpenoid cyclases/protein prenyltransferase alpha-alpha toroid [Mycena floridula]|nr:terpenoid cyclases/protein prenyltransferase alpha-alpha toroid [Mycena floridula]
MSEPFHLPALARGGHAGHVKRCLSGLPDSQIDLDGSRLAAAFYCLGALDLLGMTENGTKEIERDSWREWIWEQQIHGPYGAGFRPSSFMRPATGESSEYDVPHIIMTYTALLSLSILRDDFSKLDRSGIVQFLKTCQRPDGSFSTIPNGNETDLRTLYCAFAISRMLNDWSGVNVANAVAFVALCRTYEGGYGQSPFCEAHGGITYVAIASLYLAPTSESRLSTAERQKTIRWLVQRQDNDGGFHGRTNKESDACYCFWSGAALQILGAQDLVDANGICRFIAECQFKYGGIAKAPRNHPDPYHTYLSLAALSMYPPTLGQFDPAKASWELQALDPLLNAKEETARWAKEHIPEPKLHQSVE